jgi:sugar lactone lactonase YvrE
VTTAEVLLPVGLGLGEGVVALGEGRGFAFVDIRTARVLCGSFDGSVETIFTGGDSIGAVVPTNSGDLLIAERQRLRLLSGAATVDLPTAADDVRTNDGKADPAGRFLIGTMADPPRPGAGSLWSCGPGGVSVLIDDVTISNGLCWSSDATRMYYIDTPTQAIDVFDYDVETGHASNRRRHVAVEPEHGAPDGMTIDADGGLWVALWGGGAVHRYVGSVLDEVVAVPTPFVTCPAFVEDRLVITTAAEPAADDPMAGHVFVADIDGGIPTAHAADERMVFS